MGLGLSHETSVAFHDRSYFFSIAAFIIIISVGIAVQSSYVQEKICPPSRADYDDQQEFDSQEEMCSMLNHVSNELWAAVAFSISALISSLWQVFSFSSYLRSPRMTQLPYSVLLSALALIPFAKGAEYEFYSKNDNGVDPLETLNYKFVTVIFYAAAFILYCQAGAQLCLPVISIGEPGSFRYNMISLLPTIMPSFGIAFTSFGFVFMYIWWISLSQCSFTPPLVMPDSSDKDSDPCFFYGIQLSLYAFVVICSSFSFYCCRILSRARSKLQSEVKSISRETVFGNMPYFLALVSVSVFGMALGIPYQYDLGEREDALIDEELHRNDIVAAACYMASAQALFVGVWILYRAAKQSGALKQIYIERDRDEEEEEEEDDDDGVHATGGGAIAGYSQVTGDLERPMGGGGNAGTGQVKVYRIGDSVEEEAAVLALTGGNNNQSKLAANTTTAPTTGSLFSRAFGNKKRVNQSAMDDVNTSLLGATRKTTRNWVSTLFDAEDDDDDEDEALNGSRIGPPRARRQPRQNAGRSEVMDYKVDDDTYLLKRPTDKKKKKSTKQEQGGEQRVVHRKAQGNEYEPPVVMSGIQSSSSSSRQVSSKVTADATATREEQVSYQPPQPSINRPASTAITQQQAADQSPPSPTGKSATTAPLTADNLNMHVKLSQSRLSDDDEDVKKKTKQVGGGKQQQAKKNNNDDDDDDDDTTSSSGDEKGSVIGNLLGKITRRKNQTPSIASQDTNNNNAETSNWKKKFGIFSTNEQTSAQPSPPAAQVKSGPSRRGTVGAAGVQTFGVKKKNDDTESLGSTNS